MCIFFYSNKKKINIKNQKIIFFNFHMQKNKNFQLK